MAKHSISEAARLAGVDRGTVYRAMRDGRLSYEKTPDNRRVIETAELERVFGPPCVATSQAPQIEQGTTLNLPHENGVLQQLVEMLRQQVTTAEADKADLRSRLDLAEADKADLRRRLDEATAERTTMLRLLEHQHTRPSPELSRPWWRRWVGKG